MEIEMARTAMMVNDIQTQVKSELKSAGISEYGLKRFTSSYLPHVIHPGEHVMAAVFGRLKEHEGFFGFVEGMLVATDKRVIFIDHRPGYTTMDEITYDVVSGVNLSTTLFYASVTLYTRVANYQVSFASIKSARRFVEYIEKRRIDDNAKIEDLPENEKQIPHEAILHDEGRQFLESKEIGVLSTLERTGMLSGSVVYYAMVHDFPYFVTKAGTRKARNLAGIHDVAFTVFDEPILRTAQIQGTVEVIADQAIREQVIAAITRPRTYDDGSHDAPIKRMGDAEMIVYRIIPTNYSYIDFKNR